MKEEFAYIKIIFMGVPLFFSWLEKNDSNNTIIEENINVIVDYLLIDLNCLLHPCLNTIVDKYKNGELTKIKERKDIEKLIWQEIKNNLQQIVSTTNPKNVYIAVDGVAPLGKIHQQRQRRYKYKQEPHHTICPMSIEFTPGTLYMERLHTLLKKYCKQHNYIYSSYKENGEGEHKLLHYIKKIDIHNNVVIYGLDADLLFLSLSLEHNTIVMREKQYFNIETNNNNNLFNFVSINNFKSIIEKFNIPIKEFIILCFLLGNDFIPSLLSLHIKKNGINHLIKAYNTVNTSLVENDKINLITLKNIFIELQKKTNEHNYFKCNTSFINKYNYYNYYLHSNIINPHNIQHMVLNYISTIEWNYQYYFNKCICYSHSYKYYAPPLIEDIVNFFPNNISFKNINISMQPLEQLLLVIPKNLLNVVIDEENYNNIINNKRFKNIEYYIPSYFTIDTYKDNIDYKQNIIIPFINYSHYLTNIKKILE